MIRHYRLTQVAIFLYPIKAIMDGIHVYLKYFYFPYIWSLIFVISKECNNLWCFTKAKQSHLNLNKQHNKIKLHMLNNASNKCHISIYERHIKSECGIWCVTHYILLLMINFRNISAKVVQSVLGHAITLSCPVTSSISDSPRSVKQWFRGIVFNPGVTVARLVNTGDLVEYNYAVDDNMWIASMDGDLLIANLSLEDMGFYTCHFTGSKEQTVQLYAKGVFSSSLEDI